MAPSGDIKIIVEEYNHQWPLTFQKLRMVYAAHLGDLVKAIHHVGSTSVPGLAAKPLIDIDLVIKETGLLTAVIRLLLKTLLSSPNRQGGGYTLFALK